MTGEMSSREDFGILLGLAYQHFVSALSAELRERGFGDLGPSGGYVLRALAAEPFTATQLGARLRLTPQGAAKIVDDMVQHGYVERVADPTDARARRLVLAPRGKRALRAARAFHARFEREFAKRLGERRARNLRVALEALIADADDATPRDTAARLLRPL